MSLHSLCPIFVLFIASVFSISTRIKLSTGLIEGKIVLTDFNNTGYLFLGVPYAEPPVGELRFENAQPKKSWNGVIDCKNFRPTCLLNSTMKSVNVPQDEDCLYLNVFVPPSCSKNKRCAVIFYVGGGGFNFGTSATSYPTDFPIDYYGTQDIILVTSEFRVGALAFWHTGTEDAKGDYAMFDLIQGLRWVQQEITNFGGDKSRVTVMGYSSGGITVSMLTLTAETDGLFHQAIPMSGAALEPTVSVLALSKRLAVLAGCATNGTWESGENFEQIVSCMRQVDADEIVRLQAVIEPFPLFAGPVADERLWPNPIPIQQENRRPMPILTGSTLNEYAMMWDIVPKNLHNQEALLIPCKGAAVWLRFPLEYNEMLAQKCVEFYTEQHGRDLKSAMGNLTSDYQVWVPVWTEAKSMREKAPVYLYQFEYIKPGIPKFPEHANDMAYMLGTHSAFPFDSNDYQIANTYTKLIGSFVKTGVPRPDFKPLGKPGFNYFSINLKPENKDFYHFASTQFWTEVAPNLVKGAKFAQISNHLSDPIEGISKDISDPQNNGNSTNFEAGFWTLLGIVLLAILCIFAYFLFSFFKSRRDPKHADGVILDTDDD